MKNARKILTIVTRLDAKSRLAFRRLQECVSMHPWTMHLAECYRESDGTVMVDRPPVFMHGSLSALIDRLAPDGIFVCGNPRYCDESGKLARIGVPIVAIGCEPERPLPPGAASRGSVLTDEESIVAHAAGLLLSLGFDDFGYVPFFTDAGWSLKRGELFRRRVAAAGKTFHEFAFPVRDTDPPGWEEALSRWFRSLPKPCGIFVANDIEAEAALQLAVRCGFRVPNDIAVVGVDNRPEICENTEPTLSSVAMDSAASCEAAAKLLAELMEGGARRVVVRTVPASGVVERASTRLLRDDRGTRAIEFIRLHACEDGFSVRDVVRSMCVCRTLADRLFRSVAGHSILREIHTARIERAKEMLASGIVAAECGYSSTDDFRRAFRQRMGMTPRKWALCPRV